MAGHSKWAQIKRKKAVTDSRRGKAWTKLLKEVTVSARLGGADADANPRLRTAIQAAKNANCPNDNIDRAVKRGGGLLDGVSYEELTYEGYAPGGVAVLVETLTDNKNRTAAEMRHLFSKHGGNLGETGCVGWMFAQRGYFSISRQAFGEERFLELAMELGAADFEMDEESYVIHTDPTEFAATRDELARREIALETEQLAQLPQSYVELDDETTPQVMRLLEALDDHDDVQNVWANCDADPELVAAAEG